MVLNFRAIWCNPCCAETSVKNRISRNFGDEIIVLGINLLYTETGTTEVEAFTVKWGVPYQVLLDRAGTVSGLYAIRGTPTTIILDADGCVHARIFGAMSYDTISRTLRNLAGPQSASISRWARPAGRTKKTGPTHIEPGRSYF